MLYELFFVLTLEGASKSRRNAGEDPGWALRTSTFVYKENLGRMSKGRNAEIEENWEKTYSMEQLRKQLFFW